MSGFYGDDMRWWIGVVEEVGNDVPKLGRAKVRIYGVHADASEIPLSDLPYAQVLIPTTEGGVSGIGQNANIMVGAQAFGIFLDGKNSQLPLILGSIPKIDVPSNEQLDNKLNRPESNNNPLKESTTTGILAGYARLVAKSGNNLRDAWSFFTDPSIGNMSPVATAAILGNFWVESFANKAGDLDPTASRTVKKTGVVYVYGLAQWEGSRLDDLKEFVRGGSTQISDLETQLFFVLHELEGKEKRSNAIRNFTDVTDAAVFWQHKYERNRYYGEGPDEGGERVPSKYLVNGKAVDVRLHEEDRIDAANAIYTQFMSRVA